MEWAKHVSEHIEALAAQGRCAAAGCARSACSARPQELAYECDAAALLKVCGTLRDAPDLRFEMLMDLCGGRLPRTTGAMTGRPQSATHSGFSRGARARATEPARRG